MNSAIATAQVGLCKDDKHFTYSNENCHSIYNDEDLRQDLCRNEEVKDNCPLACGLCCSNDPSYTFKTKYGNQTRKDCEWLEDRDIRSFLHCSKWKNRRSCPKACDMCKEPISEEYKSLDTTNITLTPSISPAPSMVCVEDNDFEIMYDLTPHSCITLGRNESIRQETCQHREVRDACPNRCGICCADDSTFVFNNTMGKEVGCDWVSQTEVRTLRYCDRQRNGRAIRDACSRTCNTCKNLVQLSAPEISSITDKGDADNDNGTPLGLTIALSVLFILIVTIILVKCFKSCRRSAKVRDRKAREIKKQHMEELEATENVSNERNCEHQQQRMHALQILHDIEQSKSQKEGIESVIVSPSSVESSFVRPDFNALNKLHSTVDVHQCTHFPCKTCRKKQGTTFIKARRTNIERDVHGNNVFVSVPVPVVGTNVKGLISVGESISCLNDNETDDDTEDDDDKTESTLGGCGFLNPLGEDTLERFDAGGTRLKLSQESPDVTNDHGLNFMKSNSDESYQRLSLSDSCSDDDSLK